MKEAKINRQLFFKTNTSVKKLIKKNKSKNNSKESLEYFYKCLKQLDEQNVRGKDFNMTCMNLLRKFFTMSFRFDQNENIKILNNFEKCVNKLEKFDFNNIKKINFHTVNNKSHELNKNLTLNFEFSFFKLIKYILIEENLISNEINLNLLMKYCLIKCMSQFELFIMSNQVCDEDDQQDEFNLLEL